MNPLNSIILLKKQLRVSETFYLINQQLRSLNSERALLVKQPQTPRVRGNFLSIKMSKLCY